MYRDLGIIPMNDDFASAVTAMPAVAPLSGGADFAGGKEMTHDWLAAAGEAGSLLLAEPNELTTGDAELAALAGAGMGGPPDPDGPIEVPPDGPGYTIIVEGTYIAPYNYLYWWYNPPTDTTPILTDPYDPSSVATPCAFYGDAPTVRTVVEDPANEVAAKAEARKLQLQICELTPKIDRLRDDADVKLADGTIMKGSAFKILWADLDFVVTDEDFGPGRSGAYKEEENESFIP